MNRLLTRPAAKPLVFLLCPAPFAWLFHAALANTLGANPAEALIRATGDWTLRFLCITLAVTPLRQATGWHALARLRRMLGLFAFILVGSAALLLMLPLAATSFNRAIRALGAARWQTLHKSVYLVVLLGLLHFFWMRSAKNNFAEVAVYAVVIALLLGWRAHKAWAQRHGAPARMV